MLSLSKREKIILFMDSIMRVSHDSSMGESIYFSSWPFRGQGHDSSVGEWMYLTVCPLRGQGHDSSMGESMYFSSWPLRGSGHDSSVGEWMYLTVCPLRGQGHDSSVGEWMYLFVLSVARAMIALWENKCISLSSLLPGFNSRLITLCQPVLSPLGRKWLNLPLNGPHNLWTSRRKAEVQPWGDKGWVSLSQPISRMIHNLTDREGYSKFQSHCWLCGLSYRKQCRVRFSR